MAPTFTPEQKLAAVQREIKKRKDVYPRWVLDGKMTQRFADEQIAVMEAIEADYEAQVVAQSPGLF